MVGIIFAMKEELNAFIEGLNIKKKYNIFELEFYEIEYFNKTLILVLSGIGKVNAARTTQILIDVMKVDYIINIGVAGGVSRDVNVLDIVVANKLVQHDFDITNFNHPKGYIPNVGVYIECDDYLVNISKEVLDDLGIKSHIGVIASGDIFVSDALMGKKINNKFNALAVEMEGASVAQTAYLSGIPFLIIRSISDVVNNDNIVSYEQFLEKSSLIVSNFLKEVLKKI